MWLYNVFLRTMQLFGILTFMPSRWFWKLKLYCVPQKNTRNVSYEGAKGDNMLVIRDTDVPVITLRFYYVCVLWEYNCMRTYYRAPASEQIACSYKA